MSQIPDGMPGVTTAVSAKWLNPANMLTALRVILAPPIVVLIVYKPQLPYNLSYNILAGIIFVIAALTDKADGYYARKNDVVTKLGQFLDPLADKLLMIPVMIALWYAKPQLLPWWAVTVVVVREGLISLIRTIGARRGISFPASWSGKIKMFSQVITVSVILFFPASHDQIFVQVLVYLMVAITAYSGIDYLFRARKEIFSSGKVVRGD